MAALIDQIEACLVEQLRLVGFLHPPERRQVRVVQARVIGLSKRDQLLLLTKRRVAVEDRRDEAVIDGTPIYGSDGTNEVSDDLALARVRRTAEAIHNRWMKRHLDAVGSDDLPSE